MNVLIVEDEVNSAEFLKQELSKLPQSINVVSSLGSVYEAMNFLKHEHSIDLILMDIQLNDGISFEIFETLNLEVPIIFITAYDKFLIQALKLHSIDYLLKPVNTEHLAAAIRKFKSIEHYFVS
ncbi:MAG: LytR/AlgR family response regulator transcription factor, partial [Chitinophagaceae bacterium]